MKMLPNQNVVIRLEGVEPRLTKYLAREKNNFLPHEALALISSSIR